MRSRRKIFSPGGMGGRWGLWSAGLSLALMTGCVSPRATSDVPSAAPPPSVIPAPIVDEASVEILSDPAGARILVNDRLIGRTPLRLQLRVTPLGFCADETSIKARFVAETPGQISETVETEITVREKVPARISFSLRGAQRLLRTP